VRLPVARGGLFYPRYREQERGATGREIEQEDAWPAGMGDQPSPRTRSEREGKPGDACPNTHRPRALRGVDIGRREDREGARYLEGRADSLDKPSREQHGKRPRKGAQGRAHHEEGEPACEHTLSSETVAEQSSREQEARIGEVVEVRDPLERSDPYVERPADAGKGKVESRGIHLNDEQPQAYRHQDGPAGAGVRVHSETPLPSFREWHIMYHQVLLHINIIGC